VRQSKSTEETKITRPVGNRLAQITAIANPRYKNPRIIRRNRQREKGTNLPLLSRRMRSAKA